MAEQQMILLAQVKKKISEDFEKRESYDRLTCSKKSKELLGAIVATYGSFPQVLDDNVTDKLTLEQYRTMYKSLAKTALQSINFITAMRTMLGPPETDPFKEENKKQVEQETIDVVEEIKKKAAKIAAKKEEPWVL